MTSDSVAVFFRRPVDEDLPFCIELWNNEEFMKPVGGPWDINTIKTKLNDASSHWQKHQMGTMMIQDLKTGDGLGILPLGYREDCPDETLLNSLYFEVYIHPRHQERGVGFKATRIMKEWAIEDLHVPALWTFVPHDHDVYKMMLRKLGFEPDFATTQKNNPQNYANCEVWKIKA